MRKNVKRFLIATLGLLCSGLFFVGCTEMSQNSSGQLENSPFLESYQAEYGEAYYFETVVLNGKPLEYSVERNGNNVEVKNYGFMVSSMDVYNVSVKYLNENAILDTFEIQAKDNGAPHIAFSYQEKLVFEDTTVTLPTVSVADNKDKEVDYTAKLMQGTQEVAISENSFQAVKGEYQYIVTATDSSGNTTKKTCLITAGGKLDVAKAVNWTNPNTDVEYCREISGGTMEVSDEIVYGGFENSFKVTINEATATTCLTVKNALIEDISEYDYFLVYMYNDMTSSRRYSVNWSPQHVGTLTQGKWVPIIYPINENLVSDSNNGIYKKQQDWKNCNGLRFYIQDGSAASGSVYLTDIFLLDVPDETEFFDDIAILESLTADDSWQSQYNLVDVEYNVLKAVGANVDLNSGLGRANAKYSQLVLGDKYDENTLAYADEELSISQLVASGDMWSLPASVQKNTQVKYGDERASFEITFRLDRNRANTAVLNPSVYKKAPMGEVVFMVKNATNSRLKIYNSETAKTGLWPIEVSDEWQEVRLAVNGTTPLKSMELILYTMDDELVKPLEDGTAKIYYSNIRYVPYEEAGTYFPMNEGYVNTFAKKWDKEVVSFVTDEENQYNDNGVMSIKQNDLIMGGRLGFYLNPNKLAALLEKGSVKLTVTYNISKVTTTGKCIGFFGMSAVAADRSEGWHQVSTVFTALPQHFIFTVCSSASFAWEGVGISGEMLIADISYEYAEPPEYTITPSPAGWWQDPASLAPSNDYLYGEETESLKVGFKAGYKYANVVVKPYIEMPTGYIEFYIKNTTGCALEVYITGDEIIQIATSDEWQLVRLTVDPEKTSYEIKVRGKNETVINETEIAYYYISTVKVG